MGLHVLPGYGQPLLVLLPAFLPARLSRARSQSLPAHLPRAWACSLPAYLPWAWPCSLPAYLPRAHPALDLTVPLALPALRVFPGPHLSSKQKATSSNTTNKWQAYDKYYHKSAIYDFKLSRSCFKILQQGAYLIGSHRLPVRLIFQEIQAFFIII